MLILCLFLCSFVVISLNIFPFFFFLQGKRIQLDSEASCEFFKLKKASLVVVQKQDTLVSFIYAYAISNNKNDRWHLKSNLIYTQTEMKT